jgi:hypothetical protein
MFMACAQSIKLEILGLQRKIGYRHEPEGSLVPHMRLEQNFSQKMAFWQKVVGK